MFVFLLLVAIVGATSSRRHHPVTQKCGVNEKYYKLQPCPPNNCEISYTNYDCDRVKRKRGCDCAKNYLRYNGKCILKEKCPPPKPKCGVNEKFYEKKPCPPNNCDISYTNYKCDGVPNEPGCDCVDNYLRYNGTCILNEKCPPPPQKDECPPNEVLGDCGFQCPNAFCPDNSGLILMCKPPRDCAPGCICKEGYKRIDINNGTSTCIPEEDCPPQQEECPPNEVLGDCGFQCPNAFCPDNSGLILMCKPPRDCAPGCICTEGYKRIDINNGTSTCIPEEDCPKPKCGVNEKFYEKKPCPPNNCDISYTNYKCDGVPKESGCDCAENYLRYNGTCILNEKCPPPPAPTPDPAPADQCPANEVFVRCAVQCPNAYCPKDDRRGIILCDPPHPCPPGCVCKVGYRRSERGNGTSPCIPAEECPPVECTRDYEVWDTCPRCLDESCSAVNNPPTTCNELIKNCQPRCVCQKGYYRDNRDKCVPEDQCPKPVELECGPDEYYEPCSYPCPSQNCSSIWSRYACAQNQTCSPACRCKNGFRDDKTGVCKTVFECMGKTCGPNETYYGEKPCPPLNCDISYTEYDCAKSLREEGCDCKENYLRNSDGKCVLNEECPAPKPVELECGPDEYYEPCSSPCSPQTCASIYIRYACDRNQTCAPACRCKNGLLKDTETGACKTVEQCMRPKCGPNEKYFPVKPCPTRECANSYTTYICDGLPEPRGPGCDCVDGYLRGPDGKCRPKEKCPPPPVYEPPADECTTTRGPTRSHIRPPPDISIANQPHANQQCGVNETYVSCSPKCPEEYCPVDDNPGPVCDAPIDCPPGCACKPNYLRRKLFEDDTCILAKDCPRVKCTRKNEVWNPCSSTCLKESCDFVCDKNAPQACESRVSCVPRCVCSKGHWRNADNICVPAKQCPLKKKGCPKQEKVYTLPVSRV